MARIWSKRVVEVVEEAPDVQVNDPAMPPASLSGHSNRIMG
jgi:hypothetical protein